MKDKRSRCFTTSIQLSWELTDTLHVKWSESLNTDPLLQIFFFFSCWFIEGKKFVLPRNCPGHVFPFKFQSFCWCWLRPDWELCSGFGWHVSYNPLRIGLGWKFFSLMTRTITNSMSFENVSAGFLRSPNMDTNTDNIFRPSDAARTDENKSSEGRYSPKITSFIDYYYWFINILWKYWWAEVTPNNAFFNCT